MSLYELYSESYERTDEEQDKDCIVRDTSTLLKGDQVWIFGYGSLLWKVNFPYQDRVVGYVNGYERGFWQGSIDHRGVPEAPGRVVTLVKNEQASTWGMAYKVHAQDIQEVMIYLDKREVGGYTTQELLFHPQDHNIDEFTVLVYIGTESNPNYLGPAPLNDIARQIYCSKGKSGANTEYVLRLAQEMRAIAPHIHDKHLFELEKMILAMIDGVEPQYHKNIDSVS